MNLFSDKTNLVVLAIIVVLVILIFNLLWSRIGDKSKLFKENDANSSKNYMQTQNIVDSNNIEDIKNNNNNEKVIKINADSIITATEIEIGEVSLVEKDKILTLDKEINDSLEGVAIAAEIEEKVEVTVGQNCEKNYENDEICLENSIKQPNNMVNEALAEAAIAEDRILDQGLTPAKEVHLSTNSIGANSSVNRAANKVIVQTTKEQELAEELIDKAEQEQKDKIYKQSLKKDNQAMAFVRILPRNDYFIAENIFEESKKCGFYFNEIDKCFEYPIQQGQYKDPIFKLIQDAVPGRFELEDLYKQIKGIVIFTRFCYSGDSVNNVRIMLSRAKLLANRLEADLCDNDFNLITPEYEQTILAIAKKYRPEVQK